MSKSDAVIVLANRRDHLVARVRTRYPELCAGRAEDAVGEILLHACCDPRRFADVLARDGEDGLMRFAATAARRAAKDQMRRHAYRAECHPLDADPGRGATQEAVIAARDLDVHIRSNAAFVNARRAEPLCAALWEKLLEGAPDTELAERHGLRREYVNRAWHSLQAALAA